MTSPKSLKSKVDLKDFLRCLPKAVVFPAIALLVLFVASPYPVIKYVGSESFKMAHIHNEISLFTAGDIEYMLPVGLLAVGMVICGIITSIYLFSYMMRKNQTNVFFSMGISRMTMYVNRIVAGILMLFVAVLVPYLITYLINIHYFGISAHLTQVFLYTVAYLFTSGLAGLAIGAVFAVASGNIFEAAIGSASFSALGYLVYLLSNGFCEMYLKGYATRYANTHSGDRIGVLTPWSFGINLNGDQLDSDRFMSYNYRSTSTPSDLLTLLDKNAKDFKFPEALKVDMGFIAPLLIWLGISVLLLGLGAFLLKKRRAEHAKSLGKFTFTNVVIGATVFLIGAVAICVICDSNNFGIALNIAMIIGITAVAYFLIELILTRSIKRTFKLFIAYGALAFVTLAGLTAFSTQLFGAYNRLPKAEEIKSVSIDINGHPELVYNIDQFNYTDIIESESKKDIDTVLKLFESFKNEKKASKDELPLNYINVLFKFKDGSEKLRYFPVYSEKTYADYMKSAYESDLFDKYLETVLLKEPEKVDEGIEAEGDIVSYYSDTGYKGRLRIFYWLHFDSGLLFNAGTEVWIEDDNAFYQSLYNDLSKMTYEQLFKNDGEIKGVLSANSGNVPQNVTNKMNGFETITSEGKFVYETELTIFVAEPSIPLYPQMEETIKYLNDNGYEPTSAYEGKIKEVFYTDSKLSLMDAAYAFAEKNKDNFRMFYGDWEDYVGRYRNSAVFTDCIASGDLSISAMFVSDYTPVYDLLIDSYKAAGHPLRKLDEAKIEKVTDNCKFLYPIIEDAGRYVYVIYEDGSMLVYYLPQSKLSVLQ